MSPGHLLLIPFRHVASFFEATAAEKAALLSLVHDARRLLDERYAPDGYNIGVNIGAAAGQSVTERHESALHPHSPMRSMIPWKIQEVLIDA